MVELPHQVMADVGGPDVLLAVDPQAVGLLDQPLAPGAEVFPVAVEDHDGRLAPMEDEDAVGGVGRHGRDLTELDRARRLGPAGDHLVSRNGLRRRLLGERGRQHQASGRGEERQQDHRSCVHRQASRIRASDRFLQDFAGVLSLQTRRTFSPRILRMVSSECPRWTMPTVNSGQLVQARLWMARGVSL